MVQRFSCKSEWIAFGLMMHFLVHAPYRPNVIRSWLQHTLEVGSIQTTAFAGLIRSSSIVLMNNKLFTPDLNKSLRDIIAEHAPAGCRVVCSDELVAGRRSQKSAGALHVHGN